MDIRLELQLSLSLSKHCKMAIAFFVDPEYGPLPNSQQQSQNNSNNQRSRSSRVIPDTPNRNNRRQPIVEIDENNNHVIPDLIHGVANFPGFLPSLEENQVSTTDRRRHSFVTQLSMEWLSIERLLGCFFRRNPAQVSSDEFSTPRGLSSDQEHLRELPDLVQCHNGFSIDVSFESSRVFGSQPRTLIASDNVNDTPRRRCRRPAGRASSHQRIHPIPLLPTNQDSSNILEDEWNMELKVAVNTWKQVGEDLRRIGDQFAFEFESSIQRQRFHGRESFRVRCILRLATLPTLALVGLVTGVAYLRRHL